MSYVQALVIAVLQGISELFPVSSLGHSVLVPAWIGGSWHTLVTQSSQSSSEKSFYLAYIVALHCATAIALLWYFRTDWIRIIRGFFASLTRALRERRFTVEGRDERLAWMIILATIPVGITGLVLEHTFRTIFAKPVAAAAFLLTNAVILGIGEAVRRRNKAPVSGVASPAPADVIAPARSREQSEIVAAEEADERISRLSFGDALTIGVLQIGALFAGISRAGVTMVGGLWRGLDHEDAARFGFLLATPPILAAGILKLPDLAGSAGDHIHGQVAVGVVVAGISSYLAVRFLMRYFQTRTLTPFAVYCAIFGTASLIRFA